ncbi:MAG: tetratricopeptide repeat protein [Bacteroidota bacterium]|nr:tetratricopeptide repeat protein [Bacteroidota bacterium]
MRKILGLLWIVVFSMLFLVSCMNKKGEVKKNEKDSTSMINDAALNKLTEQINKDPKNAILYNERAKIYIQKHIIDSALQDIKRALIRDTTRSDFYITLSDVYFSIKKGASAKLALQKAIYIDPKNIDAYTKIAELYYYEKDYNNTLDNINKALKVYKIIPKAYFISGMVYKEKGDTLKAIENIKTAIEQKPDYYDANLMLAKIYSAKKNKLAIDYYNSALNINPKSIEVLYGLGLFYQNNNQINKAIDCYMNILQISPQNKFAHYNLGYINLIYLNKYQEAIRHFTNAINCDHNYVEAYYNRGYTYEKIKNYPNAKADYKKALALRVNYDKAIQGLNRIDDNSLMNYSK